MLYLRSAVLSLAFLLLGWQLFLFFRLDEEGIRTSAGNGAPTKFIRVAEDELVELNERLARMKPFPASVLQRPKEADFGRSKEIFLPD